jgi:hypothetical protein
LEKEIQGLNKTSSQYGQTPEDEKEEINPTGKLPLSLPPAPEGEEGIKIKVVNRRQTSNQRPSRKKKPIDYYHNNY